MPRDLTACCPVAWRRDKRWWARPLSHRPWSEANAAAQSLRTLGAATNPGAGGTRLELRAPIDAVVVSRNATPAERRSRDRAVRSRRPTAPALRRSPVEKTSLACRSAPRPRVRLNAYPEKVFVGQVESIGRQLDPMARTVVARLRIVDSEDLLRIGLFGVARISSPEHAESAAAGRDARTTPRDGGTDPERPEKKLVVPLSALSRVADRDVVFVRQPDGHFELHPVTLGRTASGPAEIRGPAPASRWWWTVSSR